MSVSIKKKSLPMPQDKAISVSHSQSHSHSAPKTWGSNITPLASFKWANRMVSHHPQSWQEASQVVCVCVCVSYSEILGHGWHCGQLGASSFLFFQDVLCASRTFTESNTIAVWQTMEEGNGIVILKSQSTATLPLLTPFFNNHLIKPKPTFTTKQLAHVLG